VNTRVINVRGRDRAELEADPDFVYVGRRTRGGWPDSPWGNPFHVSAYRREEGMSDQDHEFKARICSVLAYVALVTPESDPLGPGFDYYFDPERDYRPGVPIPSREELRAYRELVRSNIASLRGKTLGCWCCDVSEQPRTGWGADQACHAVILARLADGDPSLLREKKRKAKRRGRARPSDDQGMLF
jgi:hypothetical protein